MSSAQNKSESLGSGGGTLRQFNPAMKSVRLVFTIFDLLSMGLALLYQISAGPSNSIFILR